MEEQREFLNTIRFFRRKINLAEFCGRLATALFVGAGVGLLFQAAAFLLPFYYAGLYTALALIFAAAAAFSVSFFHRRSEKEAALIMDSFGFQERIVTAYEHLGGEGTMVELQRRDAMKSLREKRGRIHIAPRVSRGKLAALVGMLALLPVLALIPSEMKERAVELHFLKEEAGKKEEEIGEILADLEELREQAAQELTEEQLGALKEMADSMRSSLSEYSQAASAEALAAAGEKLNFKYGDMSRQLSQLADSVQGGAEVSAMTVRSLQEMAEELRERGQSFQEGSLQADGSKNQDDGKTGGDSGPGENKDSAGNGSDSGTDGSESERGDGAGSGSGEGRDGEGSEDGAGGGQGGSEGSEGGQGGSEGGQGDGFGSAQGSGEGSGSGRGEGSSQTPHDYVSVPNAVTDSGSLTGEAANHEDSDYYRAQNGLSWEGEHVSYEAVIGSYEKKAYEGISAGRYPEGMEDVIRDYFSGF